MKTKNVFVPFSQRVLLSILFAPATEAVDLAGSTGEASTEAKPEESAAAKNLGAPKKREIPGYQAIADSAADATAKEILAEVVYAPMAVDSPEFAEFVKAETEAFQSIGDALKQATVKSIDRYKAWARQFRMPADKNGKPAIRNFLDLIWDSLPNDVKNPQDRNPSKFYSWSVSAKWGNTAAKGLENLRFWLDSNKQRLFPDMFPELSGVPVAGEEAAPFKKADKGVDAVLAITAKIPAETLPKYVLCDENGLPVEGAKAIDAAQVIRDFYTMFIKPHLPTKEEPKSEKEKAEEATKEQIDKEVEAEAAEKAK